MRQIYNIESPLASTEDSSPNTTPTGNDGLLAKSLFKCPMVSANVTKLDAVEQNSIGIDAAQGAQTALGNGGELFKCLATCANTSRLSLANLLPSRSAKCDIQIHTHKHYNTIPNATNIICTKLMSTYIYAFCFQLSLQRDAIIPHDPHARTCF